MNVFSCGLRVKVFHFLQSCAEHTHTCTCFHKCSEGTGSVEKPHQNTRQVSNKRGPAERKTERGCVCVCTHKLLPACALTLTCLRNDML